MTSTEHTAPRPAYGLGYVVPDTALAAWGARFIISADGYVDIVGDRMGSDEGPHAPALLDMLNERTPLMGLRTLIGELLRMRWMTTRTSEDFILYLDDELVVHANANASHGYCYVTAWSTLPPAKQRRSVLYVDETMRAANGQFIPSMVTEDEAGHSPLAGRGHLAQPWYFGDTIEQARDLVDKANADLGFTPEQATAIVLSSMRASNA